MTLVDWTAYDRWNYAVAETVYPETEEAAPVYLDLEDDLLAAVATRAGWAGDPREGLSATVRDVVVDRGEFTLRPLNKRLRMWRREKSTEPPPVLAFLALTVQAAEDMAKDDNFRATAYYPRLASLLDYPIEAVRAPYVSYAEHFWRWLNRWLDDLDGTRGLPTAYALQHRFAGLPISQALVREADRRHFPEFFVRYGLVGGMNVSPEALIPYMQAWFESDRCPISRNLQRLWRSATAQERIATVAAVELAEWDGVLAEAQAGQPNLQRLGLMAQMRKGFMDTSLDISVTLRRPANAGGEGMEIESTTGVWIPLTFRPTVASLWRTGASDGLDIGSVLEGVLSVRATDTSGTVLKHPPRTIVPLVWDDMVNGYVEQERLQLNVECMLLVKRAAGGKQFSDDVLKTIETCARPGFNVHTELKGLPDGWVAIDSIQLFGAPDDKRFNELVPLARDQLAIAGGMRIPSRVRKWSSAAPPELRAAVQSQDVVRIRLVENHEDPADDYIDEEWRGEGGALVVPLREAGLHDGDYRVSLLTGQSSTPIQELNLRLRSADIPDAGWSAVGRLTYDLTQPLGAITASTHGEHRKDRTFVDGASAEGSRGIQAAAAARGPADWQPATRKELAAAPIQVGTPDPKSCIVTGAHYLEYPAYLGGKQPRYIDGTCRYCGLVKRSPGWAPRWKATKASKAAAATPHVSVKDLPPVDDQAQGLWDSALDALMHLGGGTGASIAAVAAQIDGTALFTSAFPQVLESLGHVAVERNARGECHRWEVSPTCLAVLPNGVVELLGYWPPTLVKAMAIRAGSLGGSLEIEARADGPSRVKVTGLTGAALSALPADDDQTLVPSAGTGILRTLPRLSALAGALPREPRPGYTQAERFDTVRISWVQTADVTVPGAYRLRRGFETFYAYASAADAAERLVVPTSVYLAKHLAANSAGAALAAYEASRREVLVPRGCDLPGLYARALVLCSGALPQPAKVTIAGARMNCLAYPEIDQDTADLLLTLLTT